MLEYLTCSCHPPYRCGNSGPLSTFLEGQSNTVVRTRDLEWEKLNSYTDTGKYLLANLPGCLTSPGFIFFPGKLKVIVEYQPYKFLIR